MIGWIVSALPATKAEAASWNMISALSFLAISFTINAARRSLGRFGPVSWIRQAIIGLSFPGSLFLTFSSVRPDLLDLVVDAQKSYVISGIVGIALAFYSLSR